MPDSGAACGMFRLPPAAACVRIVRKFPTSSDLGRVVVRDWSVWADGDVGRRFRQIQQGAGQIPDEMELLLERIWGVSTARQLQTAPADFRKSPPSSVLGR